jgi:hypothetical protein
MSFAVLTRITAASLQDPMAITSVGVGESIVWSDGRRKLALSFEQLVCLEQKAGSSRSG